MTTKSDVAATDAPALTAELGEMLGLLGHDISSPLTALKGRLQLMQRRMQRRAAEAAQAEAGDIERMLALVDRIGLQAATMLDASQIQTHTFSLDVAPTPLQPIITHAIVRQYAMTPDATILFESAGMPAAGIWDKARVGRVVLALLGNAVRYGRGGRPVIVRVRHLDEQVRVEVEDEGLGVPEAERAAIFQFGGRATNALRHAGPGLGLFVAREVLLLHGGSIGVETSAKGGSRFWFTLPLLADDDADR
ncbi:MAG TPA: HAMP domain-containing sensor histidine kinase [Ktedonobacterales bacterium]|nr:HAMP domain-containing sensor histidine kinase [Ktedonobacterales bacterium]